VKKFNSALLSQNVVLTKEELRRLIHLSRADSASAVDQSSTFEDPMNVQIDYVQLSKNLGLHKPSLNLMQANTGQARKEEVKVRLIKQLGKRSPMRVTD